MTLLSPTAYGEATTRIETWILDSRIQMDTGEQRGGVAGWLDRDGRPEFVYPEITGYFLTAVAWLGSGAASSTPRRSQALEHGQRALDWMTSAVSDNSMPPTRLYLAPGPRDWRNMATFSFDVAMAARGVSTFAAVSNIDTSALLGRLSALARRICEGGHLMASHLRREEGGPEPPARWSTRPGPHHLKAAAAFLRLFEGVDEDLARLCSNTMSHWTDVMVAQWPCRELHPLLYGIEGLLIWGSTREEGATSTAEQLFKRLLSLQRPDGALPALIISGSGVRSDVLAQALRVGALLRLGGRLPGEAWERRLSLLADALLRHVRPDGGLAFSRGQEVANAWCAMFAHQALTLYSRAFEGDGREPDEAAFLI